MHWILQNGCWPHLRWRVALTFLLLHLLAMSAALSSADPRSLAESADKSVDAFANGLATSAACNAERADGLATSAATADRAPHQKHGSGGSKGFRPRSAAGILTQQMRAAAFRCPAGHALLSVPFAHMDDMKTLLRHRLEHTKCEVASGKETRNLREAAAAALTQGVISKPEYQRQDRLHDKRNVVAHRIMEEQRAAAVPPATGVSWKDKVTGKLPSRDSQYSQAVVDDLRCGLGLWHDAVEDDPSPSDQAQRLADDRDLRRPSRPAEGAPAVPLPGQDATSSDPTPTRSPDAWPSSEREFEMLQKVQE